MRDNAQATVECAQDTRMQCRQGHVRHPFLSPNYLILTDLPASRADSEILSPSLSASEARTGATSLRDTGRGAAATTGLVVAALKVADLVEYNMVTL
jgi:hypothetical protein